MTDAQADNPSLSSYYVGESFYQNLVDAYRDPFTEAAEILDPALRDACRCLLEKEARLLDQGRMTDWLALFDPECIYWIPASPNGGDPRREIAVSFDDRRRLEDRLFRLDSDYAWSQRPKSRTARIVSNIAAFTTDDPAVLMVRSTFLTTEFQAGDKRLYTGWFGHQLRRTEAGLSILVKQINLIDCDQNLRNPSIIL